MKPQEIVLAYAESLEKGDIPKAFSFFSTDAKWNQPGNNQFSGVKNGAEGIGKMIGGMMEISQGTFAVKPNGNLMTNGNFVIMPVKFTGKINERSIDMPGIDLFEIKDEKIVNIWLFSDNQIVEDEFWGK